jgi:hypothetical protein
MVLYEARVELGEWTLFGVGSVVYASGHGMHLAANSINNAQPGRTAHLWDEDVGHLIWYAGAALLLIAVARTMDARPPPGPTGYGLAVLVGATWASNAVGGGTEPLSMLVAVWATHFGWKHRRQLGGTLLVGFLPAAIGLAFAFWRLA